ncbi:MAG: hypothetical protein PVF50_07465, partial [Gammaproteobacteria bacterium]
MAKKTDDRPGPTPQRAGKPLTRRDFVRSGTAAGIGATALAAGTPARAQGPSTGAAGIEWDYEVDVVVAGGGCAGL